MSGAVLLVTCGGGGGGAVVQDTHASSTRGPPVHNKRRNKATVTQEPTRSKRSHQDKGVDVYVTLHAALMFTFYGPLYRTTASPVFVHKRETDAYFCSASFLLQMDINQSSCSSEQPTFKQTQLQECPDSTRQIIGDDSREITANTDCLVNESRHSIEISDSSTDKTSFRGSSDVINENNSSVHDKDDVALNSEDSFGDECSLSHGDGSCNPLGTTVLQDDSVVEFSLTTEKGPDTNHEMELVLAHIVGSDHENIPSQSVKMPEPPEHKGENEDETQQIPAKFEEEETEETLMKIKAKEQSNSSQFQNEISTLLSDTSALCSPTSDVEVGTVDFSSTPKENLMRMVSDLLNECDWLKKEKARLENEVDCLEADNSSLAYMAQIEALEKSLAQAQADACSWEQKLQQAEQNYMAENVKIRTDLTTRLERITKQYEAANKDKEAMVIKYATSEREVIIARKQKEALEKRMKDMEKERENLLSKNKMLISERARICQTLDAKYLWVYLKSMYGKHCSASTH
ncbi:Coiled-coil domain-containing protein 186 [Portunus trituberculatus]|uniref:Coiled-coil domain-containing protein 186 n=1 Tax=Portunus trituberculatus TaxID=210409 RepID=A0A5B7EUH6_PORTR|nr:Coiled-coil domain-containing protein 186 [Portunus trituberculatus]